MGHSADDGGTVVDLGLARAQAAPRALRQVEAYWEGLRAGRIVPDRWDIDPRGLEGVLGQIFLLERIAPGLARVRLAGRLLSDLMGMEVQGLPFSSLFHPEARASLADALAAVFGEPAKIELSLGSPGGFGRRALSGTAILLPLRNDLGDISRVLGALAVDGPPGRTPRRFEITGQVRRTLIGFGRVPSAPGRRDPPGGGPSPGRVIRFVPRGDGRA